MRGKNDTEAGARPPAREPDLHALDRETSWELVGCIILLVIAVLMAIAVNFYIP